MIIKKGKSIMSYDLYEDKVRKNKKERVDKYENQYSKYCDFVYYESSKTPGLRLAMRILKPEKPSYILAGTHGWHMSIPDYKEIEQPLENVRYLTLQVEMRGRAFSDGSPDCNGWELYDVIDAVNYARKYYKEYIIDEEVVYFEAGSGGGGNAYAILGKFPDFFAAVTVFYGISDYGTWYENDKIAEFSDEMDIWVGANPKENLMAYQARSGLYTIENLYIHVYIAHGDNDLRVPVDHARRYVELGKELGKGHLIKYMELKGVGTRDHLGNATKEQIESMEIFSEQNRLNNRVPVNIPTKGKMVVAGYLYTKEFSLILDSIDKMAILEYDLENELYKVMCDVDCDYKLIKHSRR